MKKLMTLLMTLTLFISSHAAMAKDLANVINLDSKEAFFQDYNEKMEASKKQMKKLLKKDDAFLEKHLGQYVVALKEKQEDLLFDLGLGGFFRAIINAVATVVFWIFVYPFMLLMVITGAWY